MGIITPDSNYDAHLGFNFKLQFIPNTQNYVITDPANVFEAVSIKDNSVSRADCVEFTPIEQTAADKKEGIYYAYAKVTKAADDIRIRPKCALVPKITSVWPPNDNTSYPQDSSIKVSFNKAINLSDFADENGQLKNITIKTGDTDLLDTTGGKQPYYKSPYLEDDGKTLVIPIVNGNYAITELSETKDIQVDLKLEGLTDGVQEEGVLFNQKEYNFTFRIDSRKDDTPPVLKTLRIARTKDDAENGINLITMDEFTHYAAKENYGGDSTKVAENIQNHHVNKIWIYFEAEDTDSGVGYFEIKEQLIRTTAGGETQAEVFDKTTNGEKNCVYNQSENNNYSCCFEYDFKSFEDGVVRLQFYLVDKAGKIYKKTNNKVDEIDLVKDTSCPLEVYLYDPTKKYVDELEDKHNAPYKIELKQKNDTYVYAIDMDGVSYEDTFFTTDENDFSGTVEIESFEYGYDKENMTCIDLQNIEYEIEGRYSPPNTLYRKKLYVNINVDPYKDVYTKITIKDLAGNINECEDVIPRIVEIASCKVYEEESKIYWSFIFDSNSGRTIALDGYKGSNAISNFYVCTDKTIYEFNRYDSATFPGGSGDGRSLNDFGNGTYKISAMGVSISSEYYADFYSYGGNFVIFKKDEDGWSVVCNEVTAINENDIPAENKWRVWEDAAVTNAGTRTIHAEILNTFVPNQKLQYFIRCEENGNKTYIPVTDFSTPTVFTVPTKYCNYDFSVEVFNQAGSSLESNKVPIDLSFDNVKPVKTKSGGASNCFSSYCTFCAYIGDESEITTIKYYLSSSKDLKEI